MVAGSIKGFSLSVFAKLKKKIKFDKTLTSSEENVRIGGSREFVLSELNYCSIVSFPRKA